MPLLSFKIPVLPKISGKRTSNYPPPRTEIGGNSGLNQYIWTMWLQEEIPEIIQVCLNSIKKFYPNAIIITYKNLSQYVDIPDYIMDKHKKGIISHPHFSDYIRLCLLDKYGGIWFDASLLMLAELPEFIKKQKFFILQNVKQSGISNFFILSEKNNFLIKTMKIFLQQYWKHENISINYFFFHHYFKLICKKNHICKEIYDGIISDCAERIKIFAHNMQEPADIDKWNYYKKTSYMYKLSRKNMEAVENKNSWYWFFCDEKNL